MSIKDELMENMSDLIPTALFSIAAVTSIVFTIITGRRLLKRLSNGSSSESESPIVEKAETLEMKER